MSGKVAGWVWDADIPPDEKYVLLKLADNASHEGTDIYPSVANVAHHTGLSRRTVQRHMSSLREKGYIEVVRPATHNKPTEYQIRGDKMTPLPPFRGDAGDAPGVTPMAQRGDTHDTLTVSRTVKKNHHNKDNFFEERYLRLKEKA